jgi:hypothetical protein
MWAAEAAKSPPERLALVQLGQPCSQWQVQPTWTQDLLSSRESDESAGMSSPHACAIDPGYVFLPNRKYTALEVTVINTLTNNEEAVTVPWNSAADLEHGQHKGDPG